LTIVQAIVSRSLSTAATPEEGRQKIEERLVSLSRAHDILTRKNWAAAPISAIIDSAISMHGIDPHQFRAQGPDLKIQARGAVGLSMAIHELCTNAIKYGALSVSGGRIDIDWTAQEGQFEIAWKESGGPRVTPPTRKGFGSRLITATLVGGSEGGSTVEYLPDGVRWTARSSLSSLEDVTLD
jgi:two-component sensor histidine kinase